VSPGSAIKKTQKDEPRTAREAGAVRNGQLSVREASRLVYFVAHGPRAAVGHDLVRHETWPEGGESGTKSSKCDLNCTAPDLAVLAFGRRRPQLRGVKGFAMARSMELEEPATYEQLAEHCLWEAERTLDREVACSLRMLADRYKRMSERRKGRRSDRPSAPRY
jgi:hypothetical protein